MLVRLPEDEARALLKQGYVGRLGCIVDGEPYIIPINYYLEGDFLYSHSLPGRKIEALRKNPRACLQRDEVVEQMEWRSALAFGTYEEIVDPTERDQVLGRLLNRFPMLTPVESAMAEDGAPPPVIAFKIRIERITGVGEG